MSQISTYADSGGVGGDLLTLNECEPTTAFANVCRGAACGGMGRRSFRDFVLLTCFKGPQIGSLKLGGHQLPWLPATIFANLTAQIELSINPLTCLPGHVGSTLEVTSPVPPTRLLVVCARSSHGLYVSVNSPEAFLHCIACFSLHGLGEARADPKLPDSGLVPKPQTDSSICSIHECCAV